MGAIMGMAASALGASSTGTAVAGAAGGALSSLFGNRAKKQAEAAQEEARRKQKIELVKAMNWNEAASRLKFRDLLDNAIDDLTEVNFASIRNSSAVAAGISESGMEGRTTQRAQRKVDAAGLKAASRLKENYERDYATILAEREAAWISAHAQIDANQASKGSGTSTAAGVLDVITGAIGGAQAGHQLGSRTKSIKINKEKK